MQRRRPLPFWGAASFVFDLGLGWSWQDADLGGIRIERDGWKVPGTEVGVLFVGEDTEVERHAGDSYQKVVGMVHAAGKTSTVGEVSVEFRRCPSPHVQSA